VQFSQNRRHVDDVYNRLRRFVTSPCQRGALCNPRRGILAAKIFRMQKILPRPGLPNASRPRNKFRARSPFLCGQEMFCGHRRPKMSRKTAFAIRFSSNPSPPVSVHSYSCGQNSSAPFWAVLAE